MCGLWLQVRSLALAERGLLSADTQVWCVARGVIAASPLGLVPRPGRSSNVRFGVVAADRLWFVREQLGGGARAFGPSLGLLRLDGETAHYEVWVGLGALGWVVGVGVFLLSVTVLAAGGGAWLVANSALLLSAVALQVRSERRYAQAVAAEVLRALQTAG